MRNNIKILGMAFFLKTLLSMAALHAQAEPFDFKLVTKPIKNQSYEGWRQFSNKEKVLRGDWVTVTFGNDGEMLLPVAKSDFAHLTWNGEMWSGKEPDGSSVEVRGIRNGKFLRLDYPGVHGEKKAEIFFLAESDNSSSKDHSKQEEVAIPIKNQAFKGIYKTGLPDGGGVEGASVSMKFNELGQLILAGGTEGIGPLTWEEGKKLWEATGPDGVILQISGIRYGQLLQLKIVATQNNKITVAAWCFLAPDSDSKATDTD